MWLLDSCQFCENHNSCTHLFPKIDVVMQRRYDEGAYQIITIYGHLDLSQKYDVFVTCQNNCTHLVNITQAHYATYTIMYMTRSN